MNDIITFITSRFPTYRGKVIEYYQSDDDFKVLCDDFYSCVKMLESHRKGEREYQVLALDLEKEIARFLSRPTVKGT